MAIMLVVQLLMFTLTCASAAAREIRIKSGVPLPHSEILEKIIKRQLFPNKTDDVSYVEFYGNVTDLDNETLVKLENLEFSVLDTDGLRSIIDLAKRTELRKLDDKYKSEGVKDDANYSNKTARRGFYYQYDMIPKVLDLMKQSIYSTRERLRRTKHIRERYQTDPRFKMGIMFGNLMALRKKSAHALKTMYMLRTEQESLLFDDTTKFIWFIMLFERILAIHTDVTSTVNRLFTLANEIELILKNAASEAKYGKTKPANY